MTNRSPRRTSLDILDLLPHLLQLGFERYDQFRHAQSLRLRSKRVHLAIHLLEKEIELAAARLCRVGQRAPVLQMRAEANGLFRDVRAIREPDDLLRDGR